MKILRVTIPLAPMGKERARATAFKSKKTGRVQARMYTPSKTENWEQRAAFLIRQAIGSPMLAGPVRVDILAVFPRTQEMMRKKYPDRREWHTSKPDVDNIYKICGDSLTKAGALKDDCIIADSSLRKFIANKTEKPFAEITITELGDMDLPASAIPETTP